VYSFRSREACRVTLRLAELQTDLDLLLLDACDQGSCTAASSTPLDIQGVETLSFDAEAGSTQLAVVDGYDGASGHYALQVDCLCGAAAAAFADGAWVLEVDRRWSGQAADVQLPGDRLDDSDYEAVADGPRHSLLVSHGWSSVAIGDTPMLGELTPSRHGDLRYDLADGTFAGGRFVVWVGETGLQAELTLYGAGVPIVSSERGPLLPSR